jgi:hypothetical protein
MSGLKDPRRLRFESGSVESILLRHVQTSEPPASAEDEVWSELRKATQLIAAAAATGLAAQTAAASTKAATKALWVAVAKWGVAFAVAGPVLGVTAHLVLHRRSEATLIREHATPAAADGSAIARSAAPAGSESPPESPPEPVEAKPASARDGQHKGSRERSAGEALSRLEAENRLVDAARAKLAAGDPRGALDEVARAAARFPQGRLAQERELIAIDSLAALGDQKAMRARGQAFLEHYPSGPYAQHVRNLLEH